LPVASCLGHRAVVCEKSARRRAGVGQASGRRRGGVGEASGRRRAGVGQASGRRRAGVGQASGRRRAGVGQASGRRRAGNLRILYVTKNSFLEMTLFCQPVVVQTDDRLIKQMYRAPLLGEADHQCRNTHSRAIPALAVQARTSILEVPCA
jgi:hypothetical protein